MRNKFINVLIIVFLVISIYGCARTAEVTSAAETENTETVSTEAENEEAESEEAADAEYAELKGEETAVSGKEYVQGEEETEIQADTDVPQGQDELELYYGYYQISEFLPGREWMRGIRYDGLPEQEADMLLGRIVELGEKRLITCDSLRRLGSRDGRDAFPGNYMIEKICIEDPQYLWEPLNAETIGSELYFYDENDWRTSPYRELIEGKISIEVTESGWTHYYYVMPGGILMSSVSGQLYYLEKLEEEPERKEERGVFRNCIC